MNYKRSAGKATEISMWRTVVAHEQCCELITSRRNWTWTERRKCVVAHCEYGAFMCVPCGLSFVHRQSTHTHTQRKKEEKFHFLSPNMRRCEQKIKRNWDIVGMWRSWCDSIFRCEKRKKKKYRFTSDLRPIEIQTKPIIIIIINVNYIYMIHEIDGDYWLMFQLVTFDMLNLCARSREGDVWNYGIRVGYFIAQFLQNVQSNRKLLPPGTRHNMLKMFKMNVM